jgi:DNA-binding Lrp family transcriptional regulator
MTRDKRQRIKERLLQLIRMQATGTPADLAWLFGISERSVKRLISELRREGYIIAFMHSANTYIFQDVCGQDITIKNCTGQGEG